MSAALAKIVRCLERHKTAFDLDKNGLGEALMDIDAAMIETHMDQEIDPQGDPWADLSEAYVEFKRLAAPGEPMAVLYGHMKTEEQLRGLRRVTAREAVMVYGVDEEARDLATWFQRGNANQPPRFFYGLSVEADVRKAEYCLDHLRRQLN